MAPATTPGPDPLVTALSSVDTSCLDNWVDPDTLDTEASDLKSHGSDFKTAITDAKSSWQGLSTCFTAPGDASLYAALDTPATKASNVSTATSNISSAITTFASTVRSLEPERNSLIAEAASLNSCISNAKQNLSYSLSPPSYDGSQCHPGSDPLPPPPPGGSASSSPHQQLDFAASNLRFRISALVAQYKNAVDTCVSSLNNLNDDGTQGSPPSTSGKVNSMVLQESGLAGYEALKKKYLGNWKNFSMTIKGKTFRPPKFAINFSNWKTAAKESVKTAAKSAAKSVAGKSKVLSTVGKGLGAVGKQMSGVGAAVSAVFTYNDEYNAADKKSREANPGLSDKDRKSQVRETAAVRTAGQVGVTSVASAALSAAAIGAAGGSVAPGVGTAIGFVAGLAVGAATMIPTGGGKNVGDRIGDGAEAVWSGAKKAGSGIKNAFKKIF